MVADNDEDLLTAKGASLQEVDQLEPLTHFGAMIARQITDDTVTATGPRNIAGGLVGDPTKNIVNSVSKFLFGFVFFIVLVVETNVPMCVKINVEMMYVHLPKFRVPRFTISEDIFNSFHFLEWLHNPNFKQL